MTTDKTLVLITGGNAGIGFELASQLLADSSKHVILGCRSEVKGKAAIDSLKARQLPGEVELLIIDVANDESISEAAKSVDEKHGRLDVLVHNAAVAPLDGTPAEQFALCFQTNSTSAYLMGEAFWPLLRKSKGQARLINVSSGAGSIARRLTKGSPSWQRGFFAIAYSTSKTAMNAIASAQTVVYGEEGLKVFSFCPGYTVSNLTHLNKEGAGGQPTSAGAAPLVKIINGERDDEHGCFLNADGQFEW